MISFHEPYECISRSSLVVVRRLCRRCRGSGERASMQYCANESIADKTNVRRVRSMAFRFEMCAFNPGRGYSKSSPANHYGLRAKSQSQTVGDSSEMENEQKYESMCWSEYVLFVYDASTKKLLHKSFINLRLHKQFHWESSTQKTAYGTEFANLFSKNEKKKKKRCAQVQVLLYLKLR